MVGRCVSIFQKLQQDRKPTPIIRPVSVKTKDGAKLPSMAETKSDAFSGAIVFLNNAIPNQMAVPDEVAIAAAFTLLPA
ncbi:MAG: hypothetical protein IPH94_07020 [Saprospiraceae bacterium]|nr:hypothetical protein [Saprospiraceae bacterium]